MRLSLTVRVALLAALLSITSSAVIIVFIHWRMIGNAATALQEQVLEEAGVLSNIYASGGRRALDRAVRVASRDPRFLASIIDNSGKPLVGNVDITDPQGTWRAGYRTGTIRRRGNEGRPVAAGFMLRPLGEGVWLLSGRSFDDQLAFQATFQRSLLIALIISLLIGLFCGIVVARYVGSRVGGLVAVARGITGGDFARRMPIAGSNDSFDSLSREINHMLDRITTLMDELRTLTDSLAHDLRSPVGRLRARVDAALHAEDEERRDHLLAGVIQEADALMRILTTVMEIGKSEAMTSRKQFAWLEPDELAAEIADMYEPLLEDAGLALVTRIAAPLPRLFGHRQLLAQALSNLVDNAVKYGAAGGRIEIFASALAGRLQLGVADSGPGIAPEDLAEARRRFGRLEPERPVGGAGLGLALAEAVAHLHKGALALENNRPGLRATLDLPIADDLPKLVG